MLVCDMIGLRVGSEVYMHSMGIKRKLVRLSVNCDWKRQVNIIFHGGSVTIHSGEQTVSSFPH